MGTALANIPVQVVVDAAGLKAWLVPTDGAEPCLFTPQNVNIALEAAEIPVDDRIVALIAEFVRTASKRKNAAKKTLLAEGTPPRDGVDAAFEWQKPPPTTDLRQFDYRVWAATQVAAAGEAIGRIVAATEGVAGVDVRGRPIPPAKPQGAPLQLGEGVRSDDGVTVTATCGGRIVYDPERHSLSIRPHLEVDEQINPERGPLTFAQDVLCRQAVGEGVRLTVRGSLVSLASIEAAEIDASGDIAVQFGILGRGRGRVASGGDVVVKFCEDANVTAGGDLYLGTNAINSRLTVKGTLYGGEAAVIGGETRVGVGLSVGTLGSEGGAPTQVFAAAVEGAGQRVRELEEANQKRREEIARIRLTLRPLMANLKRLSPAQREQVTALCYQADSMEEELNAAEEQRKQLAAATGEGALIRVGGCIHAGVAITIGTRQTVFGREVRGPVTVAVRKLKGVTQMVTIHEPTGSVTVLKCRKDEG